MTDPLVRELLALAGGRGAVLLHKQRAWASITFSGTTHKIALAFTGAESVAGGERLLRTIASHEFRLPKVEGRGQLVADVTVTETVRLTQPQPQLDLTIEVLTLEDA